MPVTRLPCVLVALERERLFLHRTLRIDAELRAPCRAFACSHQQQPILVAETGVGATRTLAALDWLLRRPTVGDCYLEPSSLVFSGFAGALSETLRVGDVVHANVELLPQVNTGLTRVIVRKATIRAAQPVRPVGAKSFSTKPQAQP